MNQHFEKKRKKKRCKFDPKKEMKRHWKWKMLMKEFFAKIFP